jgi:hypothetical protein
MNTPPSNEDEFADVLAEKLRRPLNPHLVARKKSLLYDLSFDDKGKVALGVDPDSGEPVRGRGRGFEQDILVYDEISQGHTSIIPRIVAEVKFKNVTTHDVLVYSEKADRIRRVYPYVRYGFILGGMKTIPARVLRLGQRFDFMVAIDASLGPAEMSKFSAVMLEETEISKRLCDVLFGTMKPKLFRRSLVVE